MTLLLSILIILSIICLLQSTVIAFQTPPSHPSRVSGTALRNDNSDGGDNASIAEAERLLAKAKALRESLPTSSAAPNAYLKQGKIVSEFSLSENQLDNSFRLYLDIGREKGTWMDPRWGASGRRIECTLDVSFAKDEQQTQDDDDDSPSPEQQQLLASETADRLLKTVTNTKSSLSPVYKLQTAPYARLRGGFDKMVIQEGGFCIESTPSASSSTLRFCISVAGTKDGDVIIPEGLIYFALPYFGIQGSTNTMALSTKEGTITVKQMGWNTGWRREESRIFGVFRAVLLKKAKTRDKF